MLARQQPSASTRLLHRHLMVAANLVNRQLVPKCPPLTDRPATQLAPCYTTVLLHWPQLDSSTRHALQPSQNGRDPWIPGHRGHCSNARTLSTPAVQTAHRRSPRMEIG